MGKSDLKQIKSKATISNTPKATIKDVQNAGMEMTLTNIAIDWEELTGWAGIKFPSEETRQEAEAVHNQVCKVLAVGDGVKHIKVGNFVLLGGAGRLLTVNDRTYGIIKEHMVDCHFKTRPKVGKDEGESQGAITTKLTERELKKFSDKHQYKH